MKNIRSSPRSLGGAVLGLALSASTHAGAFAAEVTASYTNGTEVPLTAAGYTATSNTVTFALNYAPPPGTELTVVRNFGPGFITGQFTGLAQGQVVPLTFGGTTYNFVANYYGGRVGRDLVLVWAKNRAFAWGARDKLGGITGRDLPVAVATDLVPAGGNSLASWVRQLDTISQTRPSEPPAASPA